MGPLTYKVFNLYFSIRCGTYNSHLHTTLRFWGGAWWIDGLTLEGECFVQVWVICPTTNLLVNAKHLTSKRTHKPTALRFWVRVWCLSYLCGCSSLDVDGPPGSPREPIMVSESRSTKGTTEAAGPFTQKGEMAVQCRSVAEKPITAIQASKSFRLRGSMMN